MFKRVLLFSLIMAVMVLHALTINYQTQSPDSRAIDSLPKMMDPGLPALQYHPHRILIPQGKKVTDVDIILDDPVNFSYRYVDFAQQQQPISHPVEAKVYRNEKVYTTDAQFPPYKFRNLGIQRMNGHDILILNSYPYSYNPVRMILQCWKSRIHHFR